jgi:hypothetical protein
LLLLFSEQSGAECVFGAICFKIEALACGALDTAGAGAGAGAAGAAISAAIGALRVAVFVDALGGGTTLVVADIADCGGVGATVFVVVGVVGVFFVIAAVVAVVAAVSPLLTTLVLRGATTPKLDGTAAIVLGTTGLTVLMLSRAIFEISETFL